MILFPRFMSLKDRKSRVLTIKLKDMQKGWRKRNFAEAGKLMQNVWDNPEDPHSEQILFEFCCQAFQDPRKMDPKRMAWIFPTWWNKRNLRSMEASYKKRSVRYIETLKSLREYGYRPKVFRQGYIRIDKHFALVDGNHRSEILHCIYGEDYEVEVKQITWIGEIFYLFFKYMIMIGFFTFLFILILLRLAETLIKLPFWICGFVICNSLWKLFGIDICGRQKKGSDKSSSKNMS